MGMVILISVLFSNIYSESIYNHLTDEYEANINNINAGFENLYKEMGQMYLTLQMDINVFSFLNEYEKDEVVKNQAYLSAYKTYQISPYVDSIVLYNTNTEEYILIGQGGFDPAETVNSLRKAFKDKLDTKIILPNEVRTEDVRYSGKRNLISLAYGATSFNNKKIDNIVIINLDRDITQKGILEMGSGTTIVCDRDGKEITLSAETIKKLGIPVKEYFDAVSPETGNTGHKMLQVDNDTKMVSYVKNQNYGWTLINIRSYKDVLGGIREKTNRVVLIALLLIVLCLCAGYILSRLLYSPIKKVTRTFRLSRYADGIDPKGDISLISRVYEEALKHVGNLEKKNENYLPKIKEDLLRNILRFGRVDGENGNLNEYQLNIRFHTLFVVVVETVFDNRDNEQKRSFFDSAIAQSALNLLGKRFRSEAVNMENGEICLLLNFIDEKNNSMDILLEALEELKELLVKISGGNVTIGVGGLANSMEECCGAYMDALEMVKYRFVFGYGKVIYKRYIEENLTSSTNYPKEIEKKLLSAIYANNRVQFEQHLENIIQTLKNYIYEDVILIVYQLIIESIRAMNEVTEGYRQLKVHYDILNSTSGRVQTIDRLKDWMLGMFDQFQEIKKELDSVKSNKYYALLDEIKEYINSNYSDINLSVELLAEIAGYTPNYFARIFKTVTGQYVNDYIRQVRITKSKELLRTTENSINDISAMVGFINTTYFFSAFKKDVGLTPAQYRNYKSNL
jgi:AraC-like DNA-binding protein